MQVLAHDSDFGLNGVVTYSIEDKKGDENKDGAHFLVIDPESGVCVCVCARVCASVCVDCG